MVFNITTKVTLVTLVTIVTIEATIEVTLVTNVLRGQDKFDMLI